MKKIMNVPNAISVFRILLIPVFAVLYLTRDPNDYGVAAGVVLAVSAATDMLDGYIARRFNQVTPLGQVLVPIADKLTQATVVICIAISNAHNKFLLPIVSIFIIKEGLLALGSLILFKKGSRPSEINASVLA